MELNEAQLHNYLRCDIARALTPWGKMEQLLPTSINNGPRTFVIQQIKNEFNIIKGHPSVLWTEEPVVNSLALLPPLLPLRSSES